jgi:hypothetical protein
MVAQGHIVAGGVNLLRVEGQNPSIFPECSNPVVWFNHSAACYNGSEGAYKLEKFVNSCI